LLPKEQDRTFAAFSRAAKESVELDPKTTVMLHLAAAMAVGCYP
jgi:hypothetical protein